MLNLARAEDVPGYHYLAVTAFDHWLSRVEANELLENVSEEEQTRRNDSVWSMWKVGMIDVMYLRDVSIKGRLMILAKECGVHILERWNYQADARILV